MVAVAVDPITGDTECINAGHLAPVAVSETGQTRYLQSEVNTALGVGNFSVVSEKGRIRPGEVLVLYTDGLTELRNHAQEMLGSQKVAEVIRAGLLESAASAEGIRDRIWRLADGFRGTRVRHDDTTFLVARLPVADTPGSTRASRDS